MAELAHEARMTRHLGVPTDDWLVIFTFVGGYPHLPPSPCREFGEAPAITLISCSGDAGKQVTGN
jgi:hypothetical protein